MKGNHSGNITNWVTSHACYNLLLRDGRYHELEGALQSTQGN
jgi:hypothetical protein